jgi:hypothetical protein
MQQQSHEFVAQYYMRHKGYPDVRPFRIEKLRETPCWYFYYDLPEGELELEVFWNSTDWEAMVTCFSLRDRTPEPVGR